MGGGRASFLFQMVLPELVGDTLSGFSSDVLSSPVSDTLDLSDRRCREGTGKRHQFEK